MRAAMQASSSAGLSSAATATVTQAALQQADLSQLEGKLKIIGERLLQCLELADAERDPARLLVGKEHAG